MRPTALPGTSSLKVAIDVEQDVETTTSVVRPSQPQKLRSRRRKIEDRLSSLDTDGDGVISKEELVTFIEETVATEQQLRYVTWTAFALLLFTIVLLAATTGLTFAVVRALKDTKSESGALMDKTSAQTLRTASGGYMRVDVTGVSPSNSTTRRRLLSDVTPDITIPRSNVAAACQWLVEGNAAFPMSTKDTTGNPQFPVGTAMIVDETGCVAFAHDANSLMAVSGVVTYHGLKYQVICAEGANTCSLTFMTPPRSQPANPISSDPTMTDTTQINQTTSQSGNNTQGGGSRRLRRLLAGSHDQCSQAFGEPVITTVYSSRLCKDTPNTNPTPDPAKAAPAIARCLMTKYPLAGRQTDVTTACGAFTYTRESDPPVPCQQVAFVACMEVEFQQSDEGGSEANEQAGLLYQYAPYDSNVAALYNVVVQIAAKLQTSSKKAILNYWTLIDGAFRNNPRWSYAQAFSYVQSNNCFPADAMALRAATGARGPAQHVPLSHLAIGDRVQVVLEDGRLGWSEVYLFPHFEMSGANTFVRITTASGNTLRLSPDHYLYVADIADEQFARRRAVVAAAAHAGQWIWTTSNATASVAAEQIAEVSVTTAAGLVNPFTVQGNIVVDGVAVSVYNAGLRSEVAMHAFTGFGRALWRRWPALLRWAHAWRIAQPISLAIGSFLGKNMDAQTAAGTLQHRAATALLATPTIMSLS